MERAGDIGAVSRAGGLARIGRTPLMRIRLRIGGRWRHLWLKLEQFNPGGSIKDRTAHALIEDLEERDRMRHASTIIESTSGNLGVALALACRERGYRLIAVTDPMASERCVSAMRQLGASIEQVVPDPGSVDYLSLRLARVCELLAANPQAVWPDQYRSPANPRAHRQHTGPELLRQAGGPPDAVFVGVSTGGTLAGISQYLRIFAADCRIVAVDVEGSIALGGTMAKRHLPGIGSSRKSSLVGSGAYDLSARISEAEAIATCHAVREATNIGLGGSSGAVVAAAARYLSGHTPKRPVICICPDGSDRYEETLYDREWLNNNDLKVSVPGLLAFDDADCL
ncbi:MAG TPA: cysteine synthase family protein [Streptosporangiaceae bacterium]|jgi:cysteine synthase A